MPCCAPAICSTSRTRRPSGGRRSRRRLEKRNWKDRPVFLLPGNHDPLVPESVWAKGHKFRSLLPDWVHVVDREDFEYAFPNNAVLYAVPCLSKAGQRDPTESIPVRAAVELAGGDRESLSPSGQAQACVSGTWAWPPMTGPATADRLASFAAGAASQHPTA